MKRVNFGFLQEPTEIEWSAGKIKPLFNHANIVKEIEENRQTHKGWFYPPHPLVQNSGKTTLLPAVFQLPATHEIVLQNDSWTDQYIDFLIAFFGMLKGLRLQRDGWIHFYQTPIEPKLCDFIAGKKDIATALDKATEFWQTHSQDDVRKCTFGALHWHLFAQFYEHEFERFNAQYMALDTCYNLAKKTLSGFQACNIPHFKRANILTTNLGIPAPNWTLKIQGRKACLLSERRNALIHEALYGDQPVGFSHPNDSGTMELELRNLVARILLRLIGIDNDYTHSVCNTRCMFDFTF